MDEHGLRMEMVTMRTGMISATNLHVFGPTGVEDLTTTKLIIYGNGQIRTC